MSTDVDLESTTSRYVEVDGVRVHSYDHGAGTPLVLIHGSGPGAYGWANFSRNIAPLSPDFRVLCLVLLSQIPRAPVGRAAVRPLDAVGAR